MRFASGVCAAIAAAAVAGAGLVVPHVSLDPNAIGKSPITSWTTFNGDYSGQRYSTLTQIGPNNVNQLSQ
jgi:alcohol dehydrogenase (cytochrome c)